MRYSRFREKEEEGLREDIFDAYCDISYELYNLDGVYCYGDFGGQDGPTADPIFMNFDGDEEDYNNHYNAFLKRRSFDLFLEFDSERCMRVVDLLIVCCAGLISNLTGKSNKLHIVFPSRLSYDELDNIKNIFDVVYDVIREYNK